MSEDKIILVVLGYLPHNLEVVQQDLTRRHQLQAVTVQLLVGQVVRHLLHLHAHPLLRHVPSVHVKVVLLRDISSSVSASLASPTRYLLDLPTFARLNYIDASLQDHVALAKHD